MNDDPIVLNVRFDAVAGREQDLARELHALIAPTRKEIGCLIYELYRDPDNHGRFMFHEGFVGQAALDLHVNSPHFKKFQSYRAENDPIAVEAVTRWRSVD
jgi:quinol monooxygenase YgiN